ncbi:MAG: MFS transporter [Alphaproteobacteria bacterium]|nr:MFS transporter [Alphaproteobacteria bacterium]
MGQTQPVGPALAITFGNQIAMAMPVGAASVLTPAMAAGMDVPISLLGVYAAILWSAAMIGSLASGWMLAWMAPVRALQVMMLVTAAAAWCVASGRLWLVAAGAVLMGLAAGPEVPASVQLLTRVTPAARRSFVFSAKSTGWQVGMATLGLIAPPLTATYGWQGCLIVLGAISAAAALAQEPQRRRYDTAHPTSRPPRGVVLGSIRAVTQSPDLLRLTLVAGVLSVPMTVLMSFQVSLLSVELGYGLALAGTVFACSQGGCVVGRLLGGYAAGRWIAPDQFLILIGFAMAAMSTAFGLTTPQWPVAAVVVVVVLLGMAGAAWLGVCLAEVSRMAPPHQVGFVTGGLLFFHYLAIIVTPILFAGGATLFGYRWAYIGVGAVTGLGLVLLLLLPARARR